MHYACNNLRRSDHSFLARIVLSQTLSDAGLNSVNYSQTHRYRYFIKLQKMGDSQCILFAHHKPNEEPTREWQVPTGRDGVCLLQILSHVYL